MIYNSISRYLKAKNNYLNTHGKIINGKGFYVVRGKLIPDEEYFRHNSMPAYEPKPKENPDKTGVGASIVIR